MSDEKRKNARLQGRFSDDHKSSRKEKQKRTSDPSGEESSSRNSFGKSKNYEKSFQAAEGFNVKYEKNAKGNFSQLEDKVKPVEISTAGEHVLSQTENGTSRIIYEPNFMPKEKAEELMTILNHCTPWHDKNIVIHGQEVPQPRLVAWYGPFPYAYSGAILDAAEMPELVEKIKSDAEAYLENHDIRIKLNSVLLNLYRNEKDSVAWHSDDELSLGTYPTIASVSLGAVRKFEMKMKQNVSNTDPKLTSRDYVVNLTPGSLIIMDGCMQKDWKHRVPKEFHDKGPRINLTFRTVYSNDEMPSQVPLNSGASSCLFSQPSQLTKQNSNNAHIFDTENFPPLSSASIQSENNSSKSQNSYKTEPARITSEDTFASSTNQTQPNDLSNFNDETKEIHQITPHQNFDSTENGNAYVTADALLSNSQTGPIGFISEVQNAGNESDTGVNKCDKSYTQDVSDKGVKQIGHSELNANAPEYVPKCHASHAETEFEKISLVKLGELFNHGKVPQSQYKKFSKVLFDKIHGEASFFSDRDHYELDVLDKLNDGSQNEKNEKVILDRLCSMIQNAASRNRRMNSGYSNVPSNRYYRDGGNRPTRGSYKGANYKGRNY